MKNKTKIFLVLIQEKENKAFNTNFIKKSSRKKMSHFWKFSNSKNNINILNTVQKNDWFLFAYDGKYNYAAQVSDSHNLDVSFKNILSINHSFMRTNDEFGISSNIPSIHTFSLLDYKAHFHTLHYVLLIQVYSVRMLLIYFPNHCYIQR